MSYEKSAPFYDLFDQKENIGFFLHYAVRAGEALDIGAGTGRVALPIAQRGVTVCCVEPSPAMRAQLEKKLERYPEIRSRVKLVAGNASSFAVDRLFPLALLSGTFDHFLDHGSRTDALKNIARHLHPAGRLVFDVFLGLMKDRPLSPAGEVKTDDGTVKRFVGGRLLNSRRQLEVRLVYEVYAGGERVDRIEETGLVGLADRSEVHEVLQEAGFEVEREWGGYDFKPYESGDPLLIVEAVKEHAPRLRGRLR